MATIRPTREAHLLSKARLFVGQLEPYVTEQDLFPIFSAYGKVLHINVVRHSTTVTPNEERRIPTAFVWYETTAEADAAIACLHNVFTFSTLDDDDVKRRYIQVSYADKSPECTKFGEWQKKQAEAARRSTAAAAAAATTLAAPVPAAVAAPPFVAAAAAPPPSFAAAAASAYRLPPNADGSQRQSRTDPVNWSGYLPTRQDSHVQGNATGLPAWQPSQSGRVSVSVSVSGLGDTRRFGSVGDAPEDDSVLMGSINPSHDFGLLAAAQY